MKINSALCTRKTFFGGYAACKQEEQFIYNLNKASVEYSYYGEVMDDGFYNTKFFSGTSGSTYVNLRYILWFIFRQPFGF